MMTIDGQYAGRVSGGLNESVKLRILKLPTQSESPFTKLPADLSNIKLVWLKKPFTAIVSAQEMSDYGQCATPKL